jgi:hypothetical protein
MNNKRKKRSYNQELMIYFKGKGSTLIRGIFKLNKNDYCSFISLYILINKLSLLTFIFKILNTFNILPR